MRPVLLFLCFFGAFNFFAGTAAQASCTMYVDGNTKLCPGTLTTLTAIEGFVEYYWNTGDTSRIIMVGAGEYKVVGRTADGCIATSSVNVEIHNIGIVNIVGASKVEGNFWAQNRYEVIPASSSLTPNSALYVIFFAEFCKKAW